MRIVPFAALALVIMTARPGMCGEAGSPSAPPADLVLYHGTDPHGRREGLRRAGPGDSRRKDHRGRHGPRDPSPRGAATRRIDLHGRTATPGLIDSHAHIADGGVDELYHVDLSDASTVAEVVQRVRDGDRTLKPGEWLQGDGWDEGKLAERRYVTAADLDPVSPAQSGVADAHDRPLWRGELGGAAPGEDHRPRLPGSAGRHHRPRRATARRPAC